MAKLNIYPNYLTVVHQRFEPGARKEHRVKMVGRLEALLKPPQHVRATI
jgi:hypothetical protein